MLGFEASRAGALDALLAPERRLRIVDIGANPLDDPPYGGLLRAGLAEVWGFEPQREAFEKLEAEAGENTHYINAAVGKGGRATLHVCKADGFTSLLVPNDEMLRFSRHFEGEIDVIEKIGVETEKLDRIDMPQVDLIKIDIQGGERDVFRHGKRQLGGALAVISEVAAVPIYEEQPLLDEQMAELRKTGYHLHKFLFFKSIKLRSPLGRAIRGPGARGQLLDGDAVFVRGLMGFRDFEDEALKRLAMLADAVFGSADLALACVSALVERGAVDEAEAQAYAGLVNNAVQG